MFIGFEPQTDKDIFIVESRDCLCLERVVARYKGETLGFDHERTYERLYLHMWLPLSPGHTFKINIVHMHNITKVLQQVHGRIKLTFIHTTPRSQTCSIRMIRATKEAVGGPVCQLTPFEQFPADCPHHPPATVPTSGRYTTCGVQS